MQILKAININSSQIGFIAPRVNIFFFVLILFILGITFQANNYSTCIILIIFAPYFIKKLITEKTKLTIFLKNGTLLLGAF